MKIQSVISNQKVNCATALSAIKENKADSSAFGTSKVDLNFGNNDKAHFVYVFDPAKEAIEEEKYRNEMMDKFFVPIADSQGNVVTDKNNKPVTELDPRIKDALDSMTFEFVGPDGEKFEGTIAQAIERFVIFDDNSQDSYNGLLHGTSQDSIKNIIENGPDMRKVRTSAFGPGMYFALTEGDAQDYSSAKLQADVVKTTRENGEKGKFARFNTNFYDNIKNSQVMLALNEILDIEPEPKEYNPFRPYYFSKVKSEIPMRVFDEYCRNIIKDDLGIDAAYAFARGYHPCVVVFNPDSVVNTKEYGAYGSSDSSYYYRY